MLFFSRTKTIMGVAIVGVLCLFGVTNFLTANVVQHLPSWA
jgi:hypothetical protein